MEPTTPSLPQVGCEQEQYSTKSICNYEDVIDSRDIIERIEDLESRAGLTMAEEAELMALNELVEQANKSPDWKYGESLIRDSFFTQYIEELIADCYDLPKEIADSIWPWRHMIFDYAAAAEEAKVDYFSVDFDGIVYWIRA